MAELIIECFNCKVEMVDKMNYFFCPNCVTQLKCKSCGELLVEGAVGCVVCGHPIVSKTDDVAVNRIEFEQKGINKKFVASFTNHIGESLVQSLGGLFIGAANKPNLNPFSGKLVGQGVQKPFKKTLDHEEADIVSSAENPELNEILKSFFRLDGDKLVLINQRVKYSGKRDQAIRISLLLLYAYEIMGQDSILRSVLNEVLEHAKVNDSNFKFWISNCDEISKVDNNTRLELSLPGKNAAKAIIQELADNSISIGSLTFSGSKNAKKRKASKVGEGLSDPSEQKKKVANSKVSPLKTMELLIKEGFFAKKRKVGEIVLHCKDNNATVIDSTAIAVTMARLVKDKKIKREKNGEGQYEYYI